MKVLWIDTETTGLTPGKNGIYQIAYIVEIDGEIKEFGEILFNPGDVEYSEEALKINGKTKEQIQSFPDSRWAKKELQAVMDKYVNKYDRSDKFIPAGYNVKFDIDMVRAWWESLGDKYIGSYLDYHFLDVMSIGMAERYFGRLDIPNHKLTTICQHYGIEFNAHDAGEDILATRELFIKIADRNKTLE